MTKHLARFAHWQCPGTVFLISDEPSTESARARCITIIIIICIIIISNSTFHQKSEICHSLHNSSILKTLNFKTLN